MMLEEQPEQAKQKNAFPQAGPVVTQQEFQRLLTLRVDGEVGPLREALNNSPPSLTPTKRKSGPTP